MKTGRTLTELAQEIERQATTKRDYLASTAGVEMVVKEEWNATSEPDLQVLTSVVKLQLEGNGSLEVANLAHEQIGEFTNIPRAYYKRMLEDEPDLLAKNVNTWLQAKPATRMIRTLDGRARAFVSNGYRPLDYLQLAEAVLPVLGALDLEVMSCELTERRIYIKAVDKSILVDCPSGRRMGDGSHVFFDTCSPAIVISNSEVGCGALAVETGVWTKVCTNLMIATQRSMRKYHLGSRMDLGEEVTALLSDETRQKTDAALWAQVRDVVRGAFDKARFEAFVAEMGATAEQKILGDPVKVVEVAAKKLGITEVERPSVLRHLIEGGDLSRYGLFNAVTRAAEDVTDYDRATEFERMGGRVIELPKVEWDTLAIAA
jgi:hypothetical protein